jgi:hypothetical protein
MSHSKPVLTPYTGQKNSPIYNVEVTYVGGGGSKPKIDVRSFSTAPEGRKSLNACIVLTEENSQFSSTFITENIKLGTPTYLKIMVFETETNVNSLGSNIQMGCFACYFEGEPNQITSRILPEYEWLSLVATKIVPIGRCQIPGEHISNVVVNYVNPNSVKKKYLKLSNKSTKSMTVSSSGNKPDLNEYNMNIFYDKIYSRLNEVEKNMKNLDEKLDRIATIITTINKSNFDFQKNLVTEIKLIFLRMDKVFLIAFLGICIALYLK